MTDAEIDALWTAASHEEVSGADLATALVEVKRLREELAALSDAALQADLYCWGPCYDRERAPAVIHQLRVLSQPNRQRDNAAWVLLDQIRAETRATEREACAELAEHYEPHDEDSSIQDGIAAYIRARKRFK